MSPSISRAGNCKASATLSPPARCIGPNSFLVLAANRQAFASAYGPTNLVFDTFPGNLPASGELLSLIQPGLTPTSELTINQVLYANTPPWPANPARQLAPTA